MAKERKSCEGPECQKEAIAKGLCKGHWQQQHFGRELAPLRPHKRFAAPAPGLKICTSCERVLKVSGDFYKRPSGAPMSTCKKCMIAQQAKYKQAKKQREAAGRDE